MALNLQVDEIRELIRTELQPLLDDVVRSLRDDVSPGLRSLRDDVRSLRGDLKSEVKSLCNEVKSQVKSLRTT